MLDRYVERIGTITKQARSGAGLQVRLEPLLSELLARFDVRYSPSVNETLRSQGRSRVDSTRPGSLFGHVVLDYKAPRLLSAARELRKAKLQIEGYLNGAAGDARSSQGLTWAGMLCDGASLCFCHFSGQAWVWSDLFDVSQASLLTLVGTYRALQRRPLTAQLLAIAFGKDSEVAKHLLTVMCGHLSKPRHRTTMSFREWKRLFEQVSTYGLDQLPTLKTWAKSLGIATRDASQILFAIHSYYALVVKLLTSELLAAVNPSSTTSLAGLMANAGSAERVYQHLNELESGEYWRKCRISNFLAGDFFSWYSDERSKALAEAIQAVAREFLQFEPATAIVRPESIKDLLKEFYSTLVDEQLRHDLGEYYTPDWLAQRVLDRVEYRGDLNRDVLDPACGSGTFLVECIARMRQRAQESGVKGADLLRAIVGRIKGMDLNPLAVISARANFVLSIADLVFTVGDDVELPVYLADCINVPQKDNRISCRIVKNNFSPNGFGQVDFLIGNPPWVRWSRLPQSYRNRVKDSCKRYGLVSGRGYSGGIESDISTVVLYSAAEHWLKVGGKVGLLMTWTVFKSASARGFRIGSLPDGSGLRMTELADLSHLQPFPDATNETSIYLATKVQTAQQAEFSAIPHETWLAQDSSGRIDPQMSLSAVLGQIAVRAGQACPVADWGSPLWTGDKQAFQEASALRGRSDYVEAAHRGTISDLARVFWVKVERYSAGNNRALVRTLREEELPKAKLIDPVEGAWIEADLLHPLIRGRDLGRYCIETDQWYQIVPNQHYEEVASEEDFAERYPCAYSYLANYRELLLARSTYRRYQKHLPFYAIYCVGPYTFGKWKVAWMEQQDPAAFRCAVVGDSRNSLVPNKRLVPDHKLYFAELDSKEEAHYLCAYLNSRPARAWLGGFLHGKQIGTSVFEFMRVPSFDEQDPDHLQLAEISLQASRQRAGNRTSALLSAEREEELARLVRKIASRD
ncbi:MAG TPA: N-6 DNA methylase [Polyangia bacterium]|nr:N-6 DNA methylase [Polyangia bacterium]